MKFPLSLWRPLLFLLTLVSALILSSGNGLIAKKVIAHLLMPAGLLWLAAGAAMFWTGLGRRARVFLALYWIAYSLAGNPYVGSSLLRQLESPYYAAEELVAPLDALVVLGGGTGLSPGGRPAVGLHGDRLLRPATLYHEGKVGTLITTGRSITEDEGERLLSRETSLLWQGLKIPAEAIIEVPEPRNTNEELIAVAALLAQHPEWRRIGLCTSASHLPRALGEARAVGLDLIPVPCDFRSGRLIPSPLYLVPQGRGFRDVQTALWEFLGRRASPAPPAR